MRQNKILAIISLLISVTVSIAWADPAKSTSDKPLAERKANWLDEGKAMAAAEEARGSDSSSSANEKSWEVKVKAYTWIPSFHGTVVTEVGKSSLDTSCNNMLHALDEIRCMVPINLEARCGKWGMIFDLFYARLKDSRSAGPLSADALSTMTILELAGFYRVGTWPVGANGNCLLTFDVIAGARYNRSKGNVGLTGLRGDSIDIGGAREWWDPFVGPRVTIRPMDKLTISLRADVGGFGLPSCSDCVFQIIGAAEYSITDNCFVEVGYRLLDTNYSGFGSRFKYDVTMHGPYVALGLRF